MSEESKEIDPIVEKETLEGVLGESPSEAPIDDQSGEDEPAAGTSSDAVAAGSNAKKKRSKKAALKKVLGGGSVDHANDDASGSSPNPASKLTSEMVEQLLEMNPSLKSEVAGMDRDKAAEIVKKLDVSDLLTGMVWHIHEYL